MSVIYDSYRIFQVIVCKFLDVLYMYFCFFAGNFHIKFSVWERGDVGMSQLIDKLHDAVKHSICDVITEFQFLSTPVLLPVRERSPTEAEEAVERQTSNEDDDAKPEPSTPKSKRTFSFVSDFFRQASSSSRDAKVHT